MSPKLYASTYQSKSGVLKGSSKFLIAAMIGIIAPLPHLEGPQDLKHLTRKYPFIKLGILISIGRFYLFFK